MHSIALYTCFGPGSSRFCCCCCRCSCCCRCCCCFCSMIDVILSGLRSLGSTCRAGARRACESSIRKMEGPMSQAASFWASTGEGLGCMLACVRDCGAWFMPTACRTAHLPAFPCAALPAHRAHTELNCLPTQHSMPRHFHSTVSLCACPPCLAGCSGGVRFRRSHNEFLRAPPQWWEQAVSSW